MEKGTKAKRVLNHQTKSSANIAKLTTAKKLVKKITNIAKKNGRDRERQNLQRHKEPSARLKFSKYSKGSEKLICNFFFLSFFLMIFICFTKHLQFKLYKLYYTQI